MVTEYKLHIIRMYVSCGTPTVGNGKSRCKWSDVLGIPSYLESLPRLTVDIYCLDQPSYLEIFPERQGANQLINCQLDPDPLLQVRLMLSLIDRLYWR